jgi:hypothetical protein
MTRKVGDGRADDGEKKVSPENYANSRRPKINSTSAAAAVAAASAKEMGIVIRFLLQSFGSGSSESLKTNRTKQNSRDVS